ncbi:response regulator transcription factor [Paenibacillus soyae]|uniref:Response regulator transcription factor n=1 Tax=Paenibacillus soyae TaxID=2969249 RepID=A0A9X2MTB8_9BACL|nr:response regulator transcription factor [Paenibacillus soyae]MCR2806606.1 response regulator transcription factor [Paenibacillus soyae]
MSASILIVEDEEKIARLLEIELECEGYRVGKAGNGVEALEKFRAGDWHLVLLDVMLPGMSGFELLRRIRQSDADTPVILLTAKGSVEDKVAGLDQGANDYITKPFQIEELLARIRAALRLRPAGGTAEASAEKEAWLTAADLKLNESTREVSRSGASIELTPREFDLLVYLLRNKRQVLNRDQILQAVWGYDYYGDTNVVDVYIRYVRKKVDHGFGQELIHTVRGVGYVLKDNA